MITTCDAATSECSHHLQLGVEICEPDLEALAQQLLTPLWRLLERDGRQQDCVSHPALKEQPSLITSEPRYVRAHYLSVRTLAYLEPLA